MNTTMPSFEQTEPGAPVWLPAGASFGFDDLVFYAHKERTPFDRVAHKIDLVLTGPHASAVFPRELEPFVDTRLTQRLQFDYSDLTTDTLARRWAEIDERVVYVKNPVSRIVFDQNRARPGDPEADLREIFARIARQEAGENVSLAGVDGIRPVNFAGTPVLTMPEDDAGYRALIDTLVTCAERTAWAYARIRDQVLESVFERKVAALHNLLVEEMSLSAFHSATTLQVQCVHDTMNFTALPDGAISDPRAETACLPTLVSLANRGDLDGEVCATPDDLPLPVSDILTMPPDELRSVVRGLQLGFGIDQLMLEEAVVLNTPYRGAYEVQAIARRLRDMAEQSVVRHASGCGLLSLSTGAYQAEYLRETLLGEAATRHIQAPGSDWPEPDMQVIDGIAQRLKASYDILRAWGFTLTA